MRQDITRQKPCGVTGTSIEFATVAARNPIGPMSHILQALAAEPDKAEHSNAGFVTHRGEAHRLTPVIP